MKADAIVIYQDSVRRDAFPDRVKNARKIIFDKNYSIAGITSVIVGHDLAFYCD